jgi:hypothetical protein
MASGHVNRIKRPNTWLHRPMLQNVKKALANSEPSTHGTNPKCRNVHFHFGPSRKCLLELPWLTSLDRLQSQAGGPLQARPQTSAH